MSIKRPIFNGGSIEKGGFNIGVPREGVKRPPPPTPLKPPKSKE